MVYIKGLDGVPALFESRYPYSVYYSYIVLPHVLQIGNIGSAITVGLKPHGISNDLHSVISALLRLLSTNLLN